MNDDTQVNWWLILPIILLGLAWWCWTDSWRTPEDRYQERIDAWLGLPGCLKGDFPERKP